MTAAQRRSPTPIEAKAGSVTAPKSEPATALVPSVMRPKEYAAEVCDPALETKFPNVVAYRK
jgi:hypothetical protein